ncbi:fructose-1,6-bisphosphatase, cytosolic-like [Panicum miliaceum]|uniref:fructose-bisphosphatase n=1 Tax=Panicum miliaceum TaxID=4540 RepID=A0A3L6R9J5_PANMI|nr:fructose-1,6-bisphosphatase, cytosolic-like [Panicum miliaceum]
MDHAAEAQRTDLMTITRHVLNEQGRHPESRGDFTILLSHIVLGCKFVASAVNKAGLAKLVGLAGETNVQASTAKHHHARAFTITGCRSVITDPFVAFHLQTRGEEQKKLDVLSNEVFVKALVSSGRTCVLVSEENEEAIFVDPALRGKYCVCFDPLDGSSNIDCGVSIGTIFGIYMIKDKDNVTLGDVLQPGTNMLAAGYCMYGSSCTLVLSTGNGVNGFTLDPSLGEFILTHPNIKIPKKGKIYSVNEGNAKNWDAPTAKYVEKCKYPQDGSSPKSLRYIGSMVADVHRTLLYGGIFLYPADQKSPNGKLRVLYEVFPMSFLMEQAGGQAFTGKHRALEHAPAKLHDRSPIFLGSCDDVEEIKALYASESSTV